MTSYWCLIGRRANITNTARLIPMQWHPAGLSLLCHLLAFIPSHTACFMQFNWRLPCLCNNLQKIRAVLCTLIVFYTCIALQVNFFFSNTSYNFYYGIWGLLYLCFWCGCRILSYFAIWYMGLWKWIWMWLRERLVSGRIWVCNMTCI